MILIPEKHFVVVFVTLQVRNGGAAGPTDVKTYPPRPLVTMTCICSQPEAGNRKEMVMSPYVCAR